MGAEKILSCHIPKTGGTSIGRWHIDVFGPENVLFYRHNGDFLIRISQSAMSHSSQIRAKELAKGLSIYSLLVGLYLKMVTNLPGRFSPENLPEDFQVIHGHFQANRFDRSLPDALRTVVLREPLERMISHYHHMKRRDPNQKIDGVNFDIGQSFQECAFLQGNQNFQTAFLAGRSIDEFDLVGVTDHMDIFTTRLYKRLGLDQVVPVIGRLNTASANSHQPLLLDSAFVARFREFHSQDYLNYQKALDLTLTRA